MEENPPEKRRAETVRQWLATIAAVVSALAPLILEFVKILRGW